MFGNLLLKCLNRNKNNVQILFKRNNSSTTIYALASGLNQKCGVAVVRISGKNSMDILLKLTKKDYNDYEPRKMYLKNIWHPKTATKIDKGMIVWFKEPNSFTGENVCELHLHGGPAIITSLMDALSSFKDTKYAEPGEFSRRAFLNGKMDLVEIEGLADLVNAETELQRKQALSQMEGSLSNIYKEWRKSMIKCLANVEAYIDFNEDENIEEGVLEETDLRIKSLITSIESHLNDNRKGERLRNGVQITILGQPNAGKSSLFNSFCQRPKAIVSEISGTTRDINESALNIDGFPVVLSDTAGLRHSSDSIEKEGIKRAMERIENADILLILIDLKEHLNNILNIGLEGFLLNHLKNDLKIDIKNSLTNWLSNKNVLVSLNKKDLIDEISMRKLQVQLDSIKNQKSIIVNKISSINDNYQQNDISELLKQLKGVLGNLCYDSTNEIPSLTQQRHRDNLNKCLECLKSYLSKINDKSGDQDLAHIAEELRVATRWLGKITGDVTSEQILDIIFKDFCIGK